MSVRGKSAIVTGGSRGIGRAVAEELCRLGARVSICAQQSGEVETAVKEMNKEFGADACIGYTCDVRSYQEVENLMSKSAQQLGGIDVLINNAGVALLGSVADQTPKQWSEVIDTNLTGVFHCCHAAIPYMRKRGGGYIINMASRSGTNAFAGGAAYCASKFGLVGFSEALMLDLRYEHIRVSYVMPGRVSTDLAGEKKEPWQLTPQDVAKTIVDLLTHESRAVVSRVEIRPSEPPPVSVA